MQQDNRIFYDVNNELDDDISINFVKIFNILWSRKFLLIKVFCAVLIFFILMTFIAPKKYKVTADLYINKANNSNMMEINPYILGEMSNPMVSVGTDKAINNEMELIKSELVLDKVIRDNNLVYKKYFGIFPNKKEGEYLSSEAFYKKGKILKINNIKNTNVITVEYKSKKPELAYGVVNSLIKNYTTLHSTLNAYKSKADKELIEAEYKLAKENLNNKLNEAGGLPVQSMSGLGNLSAMSAYSNTASKAMNALKEQYIAGEKSQIAIKEQSEKLSDLAKKLEWAKMVEQMSDSSKVLVLKEPKLPRPFENSSPKLFTNILFGIVFGGLSALIALIYTEIKDKNLSYSMLTDNIIFDSLKNSEQLNAEIFAYNPKKVLIIIFGNSANKICEKLHPHPNLDMVQASISKEFLDKVMSADVIMLFSEIFKTPANEYKLVRKFLEKQNKNIVYDVLI